MALGQPFGTVEENIEFLGVLAGGEVIGPVLKAGTWVFRAGTWTYRTLFAADAAAATVGEVAAKEVIGLTERVAEIHGALDPIAQARRTTAVLETDAGRIVAGGARDLTPAQRALLGPGEIAAQLPGAHAEVTALDAAARLGATPSELAATRAICSQCAAAIEARGGTLTSPTTATFGPR